MEPILFKVTEKKDASFHVQVNEGPHQYDHIHVHPEYQLSVILRGSGQVIIGNHSGRFQPGDAYFIGARVPHVLKYDAGSSSSGSPARSHIVSLFFSEQSLGHSFFQLPEMAQVKAFLTHSAKGVKLASPLQEQIQKKLKELVDLSGAPRLICLIDILNQLALSPHKEYLSMVPFELDAPPSAYPRLNKIFNYIAENFDQPISLEEMAQMANLNKYSFSRYFKRITNKSFINYLTEFRISVACRFLVRSNYSISQIGFLSGFNNLSNFYRHFKRIMNCTPSEYRVQQKEP